MQLTTLQPKRKNFFFQGDQLVCQASDSTRHLLWANGIALAELDTKRTTSQILQSDNANTALRGILAARSRTIHPMVSCTQLHQHILLPSAGSGLIECWTVMHSAMDTDSTAPDQGDFSNLILSLHFARAGLTATAIAIARTIPSTGMTQVDNGGNG